VVLGYAGEAFLAVTRAIDYEARIDERFLHGTGERRLVFHHQDARALEDIAGRRRVRLQPARLCGLAA